MNTGRISREFFPSSRKVYELGENDKTDYKKEA
jgi:hypothetical protein